MARSLFLLLICLFTVVFNPIALAAMDETEIIGLNPDGIVETIPLPEPEPEPEPVIYAPVVLNYTVTQYIGSRADYNASAYNLSYGDIYKYGKMVYGHNTAGLMGSIAYLGAGSVFTVTEGGVTTSYRVNDIGFYQKTADGRLNGDARLMSGIASTAMGHDIALFTCAGTNYGNGDASHRLVVYGDQV